MPRKSNLPPGVAGPGRPKGVPNKATRDIKVAYEKILTDPDYRESLRRRLIRGTAGPMEVTMHHYVYGKPKETTEVTGKDGEPLMAVKWLRGPDAD